MSIVELHKLIGQTGLYTPPHCAGFRVGVMVVDVNEVFGRTILLVRPFRDGDGEKWVNMDAVTDLKTIK